jgi:hypothetical protein
VAVNVNGRPFGELAVTGRIKDLPAGMLALGMRSITGAAKTGKPGTAKDKTTLRIRRRFIMWYDHHYIIPRNFAQFARLF